MAEKTYLEITRQIEELKQKAEAMREREVAGVIERIRSAIQAYGLTSAQLFGPAATGNASARPGVKKAVSGNAAASTGRFRDGEGHTWSGRGPRPGWLKAALAAGKTLDDFKAPEGAGASSDAVAPTGVKRRRVRNGAAKAPVVAKYKDDAGHSWSGRGPRPGWFKAAIEAGKTAEELAA